MAAAAPLVVSDNPDHRRGLYSNSWRRGGVGSPSTSSGKSPPEDIPSGRDDDVVARQLREAAMTEPDPELRKPGRISKLHRYW